MTPLTCWEGAIPPMLANQGSDGRRRFLRRQCSRCLEERGFSPNQQVTSRLSSRVECRFVHGNSREWKVRGGQFSRGGD